MLFRAALFLALLAAGIAPASAQSQKLSEIEALQARDIQLFRIGWKLATGNAPYCADARPAIGALFHDAASYGKPDRVRAELGLVGDIAVQAVAPGSPAAAAGLIVNAGALTHTSVALLDALLISKSKNGAIVPTDYLDFKYTTKWNWKQPPPPPPGRPSNKQ